MSDKKKKGGAKPQGQAIESARVMLQAYRDAITRLERGLGPDFEKAVDLIFGTSGHVVVCGMGKSGLIGRKIAATLASTGTPSLFLHPAEAIHGDLGMVRRGDVIMLISNSGETEEIVRLLPALSRLDVRLIALTGEPDSSMAKAARIVLDISVDREACPLNLAPTTSSLNSLVIGDALAVALMQLRGFEATDFAMFHPGGTLGRKLLTKVRDAMRTTRLPFVGAEATVREAIMVMTEGRLGLALVGTQDRLEGILTDGDLRRLLVQGVDLAGTKVGDVANPTPLTIDGDQLMVDAEARMQESRIQCLVVASPEGRVEGVVQIF